MIPTSASRMRFAKLSIVNSRLSSYIEARISFAIETTLRSDVTFGQAHLAKKSGFVTEMRYLALRDFATHLDRVKARADAGGHSASETTPRRIYAASVRNLRRAVLEMGPLWHLDGRCC